MGAAKCKGRGVPRGPFGRPLPELNGHRGLWLYRGSTIDTVVGAIGEHEASLEATSAIEMLM